MEIDNISDIKNIERRVKLCPFCEDNHIYKKKRPDFLEGTFDLDREQWKCYGCKKKFEAPLIRQATVVIRPRRNPHGMRVLSPEEIYKGIQESGLDLYDQGLFAYLYLTGSRISETKYVLKKNIRVEMINGKEAVVFYNLRVLKKRNKETYREVILPYNLEDQNDPYYKHIMDIFEEYWTRSPMDENSELFPMLNNATERRKILRKMANTMGIFPHFLRHCRITHLNIIDKLSEYEITNFIGWEDSSQLKNYMHLKSEDVFSAMIRKN